MSKIVWFDLNLIFFGDKLLMELKLKTSPLDFMEAESGTGRWISTKSYLAIWERLTDANVGKPKRTTGYNYMPNQTSNRKIKTRF